MDDHGRRRFHGAFTGGFSAGYGNSVGTPEGWTPTAFKSSRNEKATVSVSNMIAFLNVQCFCSSASLQAVSSLIMIVNHCVPSV